MQQTEKYWNLINRIVLIAIVIMAGVGVVLAFTPKVRQLQDYQETYDSLQHRIDQTVELEQELKTEIEEAEDSYDVKEFELEDLPIRP